MESLEQERTSISSPNCYKISDFWQVGIFRHVLSEYLSQSHNFKNFIFCDDALRYSIVLGHPPLLRRRQWKQRHIVSNTFYFDLKQRLLFALQIFVFFFLFSLDFNNEVGFFLPPLASCWLCSHTLLFFKLHRRYAEVLSLLAPDSFSNFIFALFFLFPTDRAKIRKRIRQETKKKKGMALDKNKLQGIWRNF